MRVTVYGLGHLGCVVAGCLAHAGFTVVATDPDATAVAGLAAGRAAVHEPGLGERLAAALAAGNLRATIDVAAALAGAEVVWVTFDTPVDESDEPDAAWLMARLGEVAPAVPPDALVVLSSQLPVGFTAAVERLFGGRTGAVACLPENLRLGTAVPDFESPARWVAGLRDAAARPRLQELLAPFAAPIEWMSPESAEMAKHALNALLGSSVAFINELARVCEATGADVKAVERALKSDPRVGPRPYLSAGGPFGGGTLARDLRALAAAARARRVATPAIDGVLESNAAHACWLLAHVRQALSGAEAPVAAVLGLTYKAGAHTLHRSAAVELALALQRDGVSVRAHDPAVKALPAGLAARLRLCPSVADTLQGADVAVLGAPWPEYGALTGHDFVAHMRRPCVVDQGWSLHDVLAGDARVVYVAPGRAEAGS